MVAVVTGANRGLGEALALRLASHYGATVGLGVRTAATAASIAARHPWIGLNAFGLHLDYRDHQGIAAAVEECTRRISHLDVLINCGAIYAVETLPRSASRGPLDELMPAALEDLLATNVVGPVVACQQFLPLLARSHSPLIVNISSWVGSIATASSRSFAYGVSKAALNMATKRIAMERPGGCSAVLVDPGWVRTRMGGPDATCEPADAAAQVLSLVLTRRREINGKFLTADGRELPW
jgi:NAD(P)-dependent dehydrogenase (short-subunit alcohol dehydrogenase family)